MFFNIFHAQKLFSGIKTFNYRFGANLKKKKNLLNFAPNLFLFAFFQLFNIKTLKMKISTRIWGVQHLNAGQTYSAFLNIYICKRENTE